ncbi:MAG: hypothetical protein ACYC2T_08735 [Bacillota bacterium]
MNSVLQESIRVSIISMSANFIAVTIFWILIKVMLAVFKNSGAQGGGGQ